MKKFSILVISSLLFGVGSFSCKAALVVDITGLPGSGQTNWSFSGVTTAGEADFFQDGSNINNGSSWQNLGDFTNSDDLESSILSGDATLTIGGVTRSIDLAYIDHDANGDDFSVGVDGSTNFDFAVGDLVSWKGSLVTPIDLNDLSESGLPISFSVSNYGEVDGVLDLIVNIGPVPLPAALPLFTAGLLGFGFFKRGRR